MDDSLFPTRTQEPYADLLKRKEWLVRKAQIIARDSNKCCNCGKTGDDVPLEVHHSFYVQGYDPWEYPDDALMTLCADCHHDWHRNHQIKYAEKHDNTWYWVIKKPCQRCGGIGYLRQYYYYQNGICFRCWGERFEGTEQRIKLFTESQGKTPQDYFDVFVPFTDDEVRRVYKERGHDVSYLVLAFTEEEDNHVFVNLCVETGLLFKAFLDASMLELMPKISSHTYYLNVKTLLYKECMNRNYKKYIVIKGDIIPYPEASKMSNEIRDAHKL